MKCSRLRPLGALLTAGLAFTACDKADQLQTAATSGLIVKGVVKDSYGNPVKGADVAVYTFSQNLDHFYRPGEPADVNALKDPATYQVKIDLGELVNDGNPEKEHGTSGDDGTFEIKDLPVLDGIIVVAKKDGYAVDLAGVDDQGIISITTVLKPGAADPNTLTATISQNFVLAGGPVPNTNGDNAIAVDVTPLPPVAPPTAPAPVTEAPPPPPECVTSADCADGKICKEGACALECTPETAAADCGADKACRDNHCGPQCLGHADCDAGKICNATTLLCEDAECQVDADCGASATCAGAVTDHGYCVPGCATNDECSADNKICDLNPAVNGCRYECLANADCAGNAAGELCANNHCAPADCNADADCLAEGKAGGFCRDLVCAKECGEGIEDVCTGRNEICDTTASRCKLECTDDAGCADNAAGPLCNNNHCAPAQCAADDDCLAEGLPGGFCIANRCIEQCKDGDDLTAVCGDEFASCMHARCHMPDPNELHPPVTTAWTKFIASTGDGATVLADASSSSQTVASTEAIAKNGGVIRLEGQVTGAPAGVAYLRVQHGDSGCEPVVFPPKSDVFMVTIDAEGNLFSDKGKFQEWVFTGGYQQYQLDLDEEIGNGNESQLITVATPCDPAAPNAGLIVTLGWNLDKADIDLHVWDAATNEETYYGSRVGGQRRHSSYGRIDVDDRNGYGPEIFTLNDGVTSGSYIVRARYFSGPTDQATAALTTRVVRHLADGTWADETFTAEVPHRSATEPGWKDIGIFGVGEGAVKTEVPAAP